MKNFLYRLTSRKFLLTVAAALTFYTNGQYTELAAVLITYLAAEGTADVVNKYANNKYAVPAKVEQQTQLYQSGDLDVSNAPKVIVPGQ